ncbi:MAG: hypothetical protein AAF798_11000 [Bacteroidota bacterium]
MREHLKQATSNELDQYKTAHAKPIQQKAQNAPIVDNRDAAVAQRHQQAAIHQSTAVQQLKAQQDFIQRNSTKQPATQRKLDNTGLPDQLNVQGNHIHPGQEQHLPQNNITTNAQVPIQRVRNNPNQGGRGGRGRGNPNPIRNAGGAGAGRERRGGRGRRRLDLQAGRGLILRNLGIRAVQADRQQEVARAQQEAAEQRRQQEQARRTEVEEQFRENFERLNVHFTQSARRHYGDQDRISGSDEVTLALMRENLNAARVVGPGQNQGEYNIEIEIVAAQAGQSKKNIIMSYAPDNNSCNVFHVGPTQN